MGRGAGKGGSEAGCEPAQAVICFACLCLGVGPILIVIGAVALAYSDTSGQQQMAAVNEQVNQWLNSSNPSGRAAFVNTTFQARISFPTCQYSFNGVRCTLRAACDDGSCDCFTTFVALVGSSASTDLYDGGGFDFAQYKFVGVASPMDFTATPLPMLADLTCWPRIEVQQFDQGNWTTVALVSPKAGMAVWSAVGVGESSCPSPVGTSTDLSGCNANCLLLGTSLALHNRQPYCYAGNLPNIVIAGTCTKLSRAANSTLWQKDWVSGGSGCGCFHKPAGMQSLYPSARLMEQDLQTIQTPFEPLPPPPPPAPPQSKPPPGPTPPPLNTSGDFSPVLGVPQPNAPSSPPAPPSSFRPATFIITLRSAQDPYIVFQTVTNGLGRFGDPGGTVPRSTGIICAVVGVVLSLLWCIVAYYSMKVWRVRGRFEYKTEGFVTGFSKREVETYGRRVVYTRMSSEGVDGAPPVEVQLAYPVVPLSVPLAAVNETAGGTSDATSSKPSNPL